MSIIYLFLLDFMSKLFSHVTINCLQKFFAKQLHYYSVVNIPEIPQSFSSLTPHWNLLTLNSPEWQIIVNCTSFDLKGFDYLLSACSRTRNTLPNAQAPLKQVSCICNQYSIWIRQQTSTKIRRKDSQALMPD